MSYPWVRRDDDPPRVREGAPVAWDPAELRSSAGPAGASFGSTSAAVEQRIRDLPHEIRDEDIERDKPGHRGLFLAEFRKILDDCDRGDPDDPRWHELRLRCLDRMGKLLRVFEPDAPTAKQGPADARLLADQAAAALLELEQRNQS